MKHSAEIYNELLTTSKLLADQEKINVFSLPADYFSTLTNSILENIAEDKIYLPASPNHILKVPEGYFDNLAGNILNKIKSIEADDASEEIKVLSPMLYSVQNENVFTVPKDYFKNSSAEIIEAIQPSVGKVISHKKRRSVWDYAVAAMLAGIMAVSSLLVNNNTNSGGTTLANNKNIPAYILEASQYKNEQQINQGIASLSDDDIIKYLQKTTNASDDELLGTTVQAKDLPDEEEYLLDANTLNNYLNKFSEKSTDSKSQTQ